MLIGNTFGDSYKARTKYGISLFLLLGFGWLGCADIVGIESLSGAKSQVSDKGSSSSGTPTSSSNTSGGSTGAGGGAGGNGANDAGSTGGGNSAWPDVNGCTLTDAGTLQVINSDIYCNSNSFAPSCIFIQAPYDIYFKGVSANGCSIVEGTSDGMTTSVATTVITSPISIDSQLIIPNLDYVIPFFDETKIQKRGAIYIKKF